MNLSQLRVAKVSNPGIETRYPDLEVVGGSAGTVVNFPTTASRALLAEEFGKAGVLKSIKAVEALAKAKVGMEWGEITADTWAAIGVLEGLPEYEPEPPEVTRSRELAHLKATGPDTILEANFLQSVIHVVKGAEATNPFVRGANSYTLLEGEAGAAKSKAINFAAAVLKRPLYTFECNNQSPDAIKADLIESTEIVQSTGITAKEQAYIGGLKEPAARRELLLAYDTRGGFEAISMQDWERIGDLEGLKPATPFKRPGVALRAMRYGGVLNLEEINTLGKDSLSLLNGILDVYRDRHPNFYVAASMNPAGRDYDNRAALPPDIRNRLSHLRMAMAPSKESLQQLVGGMLFGEDAAAFHHNGERVSLHTLGLVESGSKKLKAEPVLQGVSPTTKRMLTDNVVKLYMSIGDKITDGTLDPRQSSAKDTQEQRTISLRNIVAFCNYTASELDTVRKRKIEPNGKKYKKSVWEMAVETGSCQTTKTDVIAALDNAIHAAFCTPFVFLANPISQGSGSSIKPESTEKLLNAMIAAAGLSKGELGSLIEMEVDTTGVMSSLFKGGSISEVDKATVSAYMKKGGIIPVSTGNGKSGISVDLTGTSLSTPALVLASIRGVPLCSDGELLEVNSYLRAVMLDRGVNADKSTLIIPVKNDSFVAVVYAKRVDPATNEVSRGLGAVKLKIDNGLKRGEIVFSPEASMYSIRSDMPWDLLKARFVEDEVYLAGSDLNAMELKFVAVAPVTLERRRDINTSTGIVV